jgi:hypothetical protein
MPSRPWLGHFILADALDGERDFSFRIFGTWIAEFLGQDLNGKQLGTLVPGSSAPWGGEYRNAVAARRPHYVVGSPHLSRRSAVAAWVILPLSRGGCTLDQLSIGFCQVSARA